MAFFCHFFCKIQHLDALKTLYIRARRGTWIALVTHSLFPHSEERGVAMVRLALLIMSLLGVFLLNACGGNNNSNIDARDAVLMQKGNFTAQAERVYITEVDESGKVRKKTQGNHFNPDNSNIQVDWDKKKVTFVTEVKDAKTNQNEQVVLEGVFNDEGIAFLNPINDSGKKHNAFAGVRCKDNTCSKLTIDVGVDVQKNGKLEFAQEQMDVTNPNPLKIPEALEAPAQKVEIEPVGSGIKNTGDAKTPEVKEVKSAPVAIAPVAEEADDDEIIEMEEPGVPTILPSVLKPQMRNQQTGEIKLSDYSDSQLFPYNLGESYLGKSIGYYSKGSLAKGTDINTNTSTKPLFGFLSIDRGDKVHFGSGLLVKTVEEAGKIYAKSVPGGKFEINDLSKQAGGPIYSGKKNRRGKYKLAHASHQNGLDADIRIPRNGSQYDYAKAWKIVKSFVQLGYVDAIFLNPIRMSGMCKYLKQSSEKNYSQIFAKLYKETGHTSHMHVRLKCTNHNIGCQPATYTKSKYGVCK